MSIEITMLGGNCPVQAEGFIDGEPFYFRARGEHWSLSVGSDFASGAELIDGRDVVGRPRWYYEEPWGDGPFDAGWMEEAEARRLIEVGANRYANWIAAGSPADLDDGQPDEPQEWRDFDPDC